MCGHFPCLLSVNGITEGNVPNQGEAIMVSDLVTDSVLSSPTITAQSSTQVALAPNVE